MNPVDTPRAGRREWIGLSVLVLACVLYVMDLTVLHLAVPSISADLKPSSSQLLWIIDIYGFMVAGSLITMGTLGDRIGRRRLLLFGATAFGAGSLLAAFSTTAEMLIVARALMGVAGATLGPSTLSLIFNMFHDPRQRSVAIGVWMSAFSAGSAVGPVLGGVLLQFFWWGSVFLLALPVMALLLVLGPRVLPEFRDPQAGRPDLLSAGMSLVAVLAVVYGVKQIAQDGFSPLSAASIFAGLAVGIAFVRRQLTLADPIVDVRLFRTASFNASLAANVLAIFVAVGYFIFVPQYLQLVLGLTPLQAGMWSVPSALGFVAGSNLAPRVVYRFRASHLVGASLAVTAVGLGCLTQVGGPNGLSIVVAASVIISLALAPVFTLTTELIVGSAPPERAGTASAISETASELGGALGIAILGSVGSSVYRGALANALPSGLPPEAAETARNTLGSAVGIAHQLQGPLGPALLHAAREAFLQAFETTAVITALVALGAAVVVVLMLRHVQSGSEPAVQPDQGMMRAVAGGSGVDGVPGPRVLPDDSAKTANSKPLRLMAVLAHPDDESLAFGGTLAKYATSGIETYLVMATRGERGWFGQAGDYPGPQALGRLREAELREAARVLGLRKVFFLDYQDGDLDRADPAEVTTRIAAHIRRVRPDVVVTFDPNGMYGHPDHVAISQLTTTAVLDAAIGDCSGPVLDLPHRVAKLYYRAFLQSEQEPYEATFGRLIMPVDMVERRFAAWPEWAVTTRIDISSHWRPVWNAIACHRSQLPEYQRLRALPDEYHAHLWTSQTYYRAMSLVNGGREVEDDLFAGLRDADSGSRRPFVVERRALAA